MDDDDDNIKDITPKQALLAWCKVKIPRTFPTNNFNKDWNDGRAIACLVDAVAPGLFPECEKLDPSEALKNARQSIKNCWKMAWNTTGWQLLFNNNNNNNNNSPQQWIFYLISLF